MIPCLLVGGCWGWGGGCGPGGPAVSLSMSPSGVDGAAEPGPELLSRRPPLRAALGLGPAAESGPGPGPAVPLREPRCALLWCPLCPSSEGGGWGAVWRGMARGLGSRSPHCRVGTEAVSLLRVSARLANARRGPTAEGPAGRVREGGARGGGGGSSFCRAFPREANNALPCCSLQ